MAVASPPESAATLLLLPSPQLIVQLVTARAPDVCDRFKVNGLPAAMVDDAVLPPESAICRPGTLLKGLTVTPSGLPPYEPLSSVAVAVIAYCWSLVGLS